MDLPDYPDARTAPTPNDNAWNNSDFRFEVTGTEKKKGEFWYYDMTMPSVSEGHSHIVISKEQIGTSVYSSALVVAKEQDRIGPFIAVV